MPRLPESLAVLRERDYRLLLAAQSVSVLGDRMVVVALPFAVLAVGGGPSAVGLVFACQALPMVLSLLAGGVVADRLSRRAVMVAADLLRVASQGAAAALLLSGVAEVWMLAAMAAVTGAATGFFSPASTGLMPAVVAPERLQQANGLRSTATAMGELVGPAVGGVLVATVGPGWALGVDAATFALSAAFLARLRLGRQVAAPSAGFLRDLREGWDAFRSRTWVWALVATFAFSNMLWGAWSALGPVVADRSLGGAAAWGAILACMGAGGIVGGVLSVRMAPRRPLLVMVAVDITICVPLALLAADAAVAVVAVGALIAGAALMLGNALWESTLQRHIPPATLSRVSSYDWFGSLAFYPVGLALWGPLGAGIGLSTALWLATALLAVSPLVLLSIRDIRELPLYPPAPNGVTHAG